MNPSDRNSPSAARPVAIVTGGSAGLGFFIAAAFAKAGYRIALLARNEQRLQDTKTSLQRTCGLDDASIITIAAQLELQDEVQGAMEQIAQRFGRIDVLVNNVGASDRGTIQQLSAAHLTEVISANVIPTLYCSQAAFPWLQETQGVIVNIGSLAAKVGARYLGAYPAAKHALAGMTQQMRLEWKPHGIHVALLNPGPIKRQDAGARYAESVVRDPNLPAQAAQPGGGTTVKGLSADRVAQRVVRMVQKRQTDVLLPGYLRPLVAIGHFWPTLGDWLLLRFTRSK